MKGKERIKNKADERHCLSSALFAVGSKSLNFRGNEGAFSRNEKKRKKRCAVSVQKLRTRHFLAFGNFLFGAFGSKNHCMIGCFG